MKTFYFFIISILIKTSQENSCQSINPSEEDNCITYELSEDEKNIYPNASCCYVKYKNEYNKEVEDCSLLIKDDVKELVRILKKQEGYKSLSVKCFSNRLKLGFIFLFLLLCF